MSRRSAVVLTLALGAFSANAQVPSSEAERMLEARRAEVNLRQADAALKQKQALFREGLLSRAELDRAEAEYERAAIETEKARIVLANELPSFRVLSAEKRAGTGGASLVVLQLEELERNYESAANRRYLISIAANNTIVGSPYQQEARFGGSARRRVTLTFRLLREADEVTVMILSGTRREEIPILLQRGASARDVRLACPLFSQEGALGTKVEYPVTLERFDQGSRTVGLSVASLPAGFVTSWVDAETKAALTSVRFEGLEAQKSLLLQVHVPQHGDPAWLDRTLPFTVSASEEPHGAAVGVLQLQLRPAGAPKLILISDRLSVEIDRGESATVPLILQNVGGAAAANVAFDVGQPLGFSAQIAPHVVSALGAREVAQLRLVVSPEMDAIPGDYTLRVTARTQSKGVIVESPEQTFRITLRRASPPAWTVLASGAALVLIGGVVIVLRRRVRQ